jgi:hypothetical protein
MNTFIYGVFVSPYGGLGGPPSFLVCFVVIELLSPVLIVCLT